jgi:sterol desaturase/sphingolipid hydroxylase (fatty acid hydroxylase superfamily)
MLTTIADLAGLACIPLFLLLDVCVRRRQHPTRWWRLRALVVSAVAFGLSMAVALGWASLLGGASLFDLSGLGPWWGALVGILSYELAHYWYHRAAHAWTPLWRSAHQMHHSAESVDAFGAYYLHPIDVVAFTSCGSLVMSALLGLSPGAAALGALFLTFNAMFQHANLKTPQWLGLFIQRPEQHSLHHERGVHRWNYSDLPLWDMVFGTWRNPAGWRAEAGFWDGASARVGEMLLGLDVAEPPRFIDVDDTITFARPTRGLRV